MSETEHREHAMQEPSRGSIVRYRDTDDSGINVVESGVVTGPVACDPGTDQIWVGIRTLRRDRQFDPDLITVASIVDVKPPPTQRKIDKS